jgi:RyR domain
MYRYTDEQAARVCHAMVRELQAVRADPVPAPPWDHLPADVRAVVVASVRAARQGAVPRELHAMWMGALLSLGWVYGPDKDPGQKTHPGLVPWESLSAWEQDKDRLFQLLVAGMTAQ